MWCLRVLRVQDQDNGRSNVQNPNPPEWTFQTVLTDQPAADIQAASSSTAGYLSYLGRRLLTPITHWMERTCSMRGWVSAAELAACNEG